MTLSYQPASSSTSIEDDYRSPREFVHQDDDLESHGDSESDISMFTASGSASSTCERMTTNSAPSIASSGSDMSISVDSRDQIYPHDSISQRPVEEQSEASETSVLSFHSSLDGHLFREIYGRAFNSQDDGYMLPVDDVEHKRQDIQHYVFKLHMNGLYPAKDLVRAVLSPKQPERPAVLDIGTGSGRWALEMAMEFPHAEVIGLDLAPPTLKDIPNIPSNCRFEIDNANLPLDHYENTFNLVHVRGVELGITDFNSFLYNVARTIKPGGIIIIAGGFPQLYDENFQPHPTTLEGLPGFTWSQRLIGEAYSAFLARADNAIDSKQFWAKWIAENPNYENPVFQDVFMPLGPWQSGLDERLTYAAELMRYNFSTLAHSYKPMLLLNGLTSDFVDRMIERTTNEMRELTVHAYSRWTWVWMTRTHAPWTERLERPELLEPEPSTYFTKEFIQERAQRSPQRTASAVESMTPPTTTANSDLS